MKIKQSILSGIIFSGTSLFCYLGFAAYTNLPNQNSGDVMTSTIWNNTINKVNTIGTTYAPTGMVSAFYGTSCPTGWVAADGTGDEPKTDGTLGTLDLRGEFIRGLDNSRGVDSGRLLGSWQKGTAMVVPWKGDTRFFMLQSNSNSFTGGFNDLGVDDDNRNNWSSNAMNIINGTSTGISVNYGYGHSRPRNVALLYCIKQ